MIRYNPKSFLAIAIAIWMCFQPSKAIGYMAPYFFVSLLLLFSVDDRLWKRVAMWIGLWLGLGLFEIWAQRSFERQSFILAIITYSSFVVLFIPESVFTPALFGRIRRFLIPFVCLQGVIGILQAISGVFLKGTFDSGNGDIVRGTMAASIASEANATNCMFVASMVFVLLALYPYTRERNKGYAVLFLGGGAVVLASVMHAMFFMMASLVLAAIMVLPQFKAAMTTMAGVVVVVIVMFALMPGNVGLVGVTSRQLFEGQTPKAQLFLTSFLTLPEEVPSMVYIGVGPGQFSSRAAMISTGEYLNARQGGGSHLPLLRERTPDLTDRYEMPLFQEVQAVEYFGSTQTCFASWASVATEFGFVFMLALILGLAIFVWKLGAVARRAPRTAYGVRCRREAMVLIAGMTFLFCLGFQENYWEMPQAVLVGLILMRFMYSSFKALLVEAHSEHSGLARLEHTPVVTPGSRVRKPFSHLWQIGRH